MFSKSTNESNPSLTDEEMDVHSCLASDSKRQLSLLSL